MSLNIKIALFTSTPPTDHIITALSSFRDSKRIFEPMYNNINGAFQTEYFHKFSWLSIYVLNWDFVHENQIKIKKKTIFLYHLVPFHRLCHHHRDNHHHHHHHNCLVSARSGSLNLRMISSNTSCRQNTNSSEMLLNVLQSSPICLTQIIVINAKITNTDTN